MHKYDILASELQLIHKAKVKIVPIVLTWDGIVSTFFRKYMDLLKIKESVQAYIQTVGLKKTMESMIVEHKFGFENMSTSGNSFDEGRKSVKRRRDSVVSADEGNNSEVGTDSGKRIPRVNLAEQQTKWKRKVN
ncbi:uncharacterized protein LOC115230664 [Octopus sinensis]|uniref:Uncharacterized protein LOC115230664 n=1 Tax=Octopus sinensis TaxID=2607531 RepID=A0A6P7TY07_9MOLL|nr:uncharacterized protein LOC115230664 [Octopus sinensis]